jgi:hypothetical protein
MLVCVRKGIAEMHVSLCAKEYGMLTDKYISFQDRMFYIKKEESDVQNQAKWPNPGITRRDYSLTSILAQSLESTVIPLHPKALGDTDHHGVESSMPGLGDPFPGCYPPVNEAVVRL